MTEQNKFVNTYIENCIQVIHEYLSNILHLRTQVKILEDSVSEKDSQIIDLNNRINELVNNNQQLKELKLKYENAESNYSAAMNKLKHMETLQKQYLELKKDYDSLLNPKKQKSEIPKKEKVDDF